MRLRRLLLWIRSILFLLPMLLPFGGASQSVAQAKPALPPVLSSIQIHDAFSAPEYSACGNDIVPVINEVYEQKVVELVNQERAALSLPPLKRVIELDQAARYHTADLGVDDYFEHDTYNRDGQELLFVCLWWQRISSYYSGPRAENIAAGYSTPAAVVAAWMSSPGHRQNILSTYSSEIGVGYFQGEGAYFSYWAQDFGNRSGIYPLIINGEASVTQNPQVNLYIYGDWSEIRLRNDEENWSDWLPFHNSLTWNLPMSNGEHLVTAEMRNGEASATSQDTIVLTGMTMMPEIGNIPDIITFTYSLIDQQFIPESTAAIPMNVGSSDPLQWQITTDSLSIVVSPTQGLTPDVFSIVPIEPTTLPKVVDTNTITVTAETAEGMLCEPFVFSVIINVTDGVIHKLYLPQLSIQIQ
jgi:uncharacterized protein YkwD